VFKAIVSTSLIHIVESHSASAPDQALTSLHLSMVEFLGLGLRAWMHNLRFCVGLFLKLHHACANIFLATINATKYLQKLKIPSLFLEEANITVFQYQLNFKKD
jgi:hypothetical protein